MDLCGKHAVNIIFCLLVIINLKVAYSSPFSQSKVLTHCYRPYGCFDIGGKYVSFWRPFNIIPLPPSIIDVSFGLRTRKNPVIYQNLDPQDVRTFDKSNFDPKLPVSFIIHGYLEHRHKPWILHMTNELLKYKAMNVIGVDWGRGAMPPYSLAVANSRLTGSIVGHFINSLKEEFKVDPTNIHIIGHSLGAHIAGFAGQKVKHIGRISGLDPAFPLFYKVHPKFKLDPGDALFVDVIHTDTKRSIIRGTGLGVDKPCGHVDFYPNGGKQQPGCQRYKLIKQIFNSENIYQEIRHLIGCNHIRAYEYYTESINTQCPFTSFKCDSWEHFSKGKCSDCGPDGSLCTQLGYRSTSWKKHVKHQRNKFYMTTSNKKPFCMLQRKITVEEESVGRSANDHPSEGLIRIRMKGQYGQAFYRRIVDGDNLSGMTFMAGAYDIDPIFDLDLEWKHKLRIFKPETWFKTPEVRVNRVIIDSIDLNRRDKFCATEVHDSTTTHFDPC